MSCLQSGYQKGQQSRARGEFFEHVFLENVLLGCETLTHPKETLPKREERRSLPPTSHRVGSRWSSVLKSESSLTDGKSMDAPISCWVKGRERVLAGLDVLHSKRKVDE